MKTLKEFREKYPQYNDRSDDEMVKAIHKKWYADKPISVLAEKLGVHSSRFIDYDKKAPPEPKPTAEAESINNRLMTVLNHKKYRNASPEEQIEAKKRFFTNIIAPKYPVKYQAAMQSEFVKNLTMAEEESKMRQRQRAERDFQEMDERAPGFLKKAQSRLFKRLDNHFKGLQLWEETLGLVEPGHYRKLKEQGWKDFGEKHKNIIGRKYKPVMWVDPRDKEQEVTFGIDPATGKSVSTKTPKQKGFWEEAAYTIIETGPSMVPMIMASLAMGPAGTITAARTSMAGAGAIMKSAAPAVTTDLAVAAPTAVAIATSTMAETGAKYQDYIDRGFSVDAATNHALAYGLSSGIVEGAMNMVALKLMKVAGGTMLSGVQKSGVGKAATKGMGQVFEKLNTFKHTKLGKSFVAGAAILGGGASEATEETVQMYFEELADTSIENPDFTQDELLAEWSKRINSPRFKAQRLQAQKLAGVAGAFFPGAAVGAGAMVNKLKGFVDTVNEIDIEEFSKEVERLDKIIAETEQDPTKTVEDLEPLYRQRAVDKEIVRAETEGDTVNFDTLEEEISAEKKRYEDLTEERAQEPDTEEDIKEPSEPEKQTLEPEPTPDISPKETPKKQDVQRYKGTTLQTPNQPNKDGSGVLFHYQGRYGDDNIETKISDTEKAGVQYYKDLERKIARGKWKFQPLMDAVVKGASSLKIVIAHPKSKKWYGSKGHSGVRGSAAWMESPDGTITNQTIFLNPEPIFSERDIGAKYDKTDGVIVHELLHTLYTQAVRDKGMTGYKKFLEGISRILDSIPKKEFDRFRGYANDLALRRGDDDYWNSLTPIQRHKREVWYQIFRNLTRGEDVRSVEEFMTYILSEPEILADLYQIPSQEPLSKKSIGRLIVEKLLNFVKKRFARHTKPTLVDDILNVHAEFAESIAANVQEDPDVSVQENHLNSLLIKGNKRFPKGAKFLNPAVKTASGIYHSPLAHYAVEYPELNTDDDYHEDGFAAVDENGRVLEYYTRKEAALKVKKERGGPFGYILLADDFPLLKIQLDSKVIRRKKDGKVVVSTPTQEQKKRKKRLTAADMALLAARKAAREGKTLREDWADKRKGNQRDVAAIKRKQKTKRGIPEDRYKLERASDGLVSMKDPTLEAEYHKVNQRINKMIAEGYGETSEKLVYLINRRQAIKIIQEKRHVQKVKAQKLREQATLAKVGETKKANIRFFKAQYKHYRKIDAPYSAVVFARNNLIDLMGADAFYRWSGEKPHVIEPTPAQIREALAGKVIEEVPDVVETKKEGDVTVKVIKPYTQEEAELPKFEKGVKSRGEARKVFERTISTLKNKYIGAGKQLNDADQAEAFGRTIEQAKDANVISESEAQDAIELMTAAILGQDISLDSTAIDRHDPDSPQAKLNKYAPVKVRFDGYHAPGEGYAGWPYSFTIMDKNHPAYKGSFTVKSLNKKDIKERFKNIESLWGTKNTLDSYAWIRSNDTDEKTKEHIVWGNDKVIEIEFNHMYVEENMRGMLHKGADKIKNGTPLTSINWVYDERYDRTGIVNRKAGMAVIFRIRDLIGQLMNGELKADIPGAIYFTSLPGDPKKTAIYKSFSERLAKRFGWEWAQIDEAFYIWDNDFEVTDEHITSAEKHQRRIREALGERHDDIPLGPQTVDEVIGDLIGDLGYLFDSGRNNYENYHLPTNMFYQHTDGGQYESLIIEIEYDESGNNISISMNGIHRHYDEVVNLWKIGGSHTNNAIEIYQKAKQLINNMKEKFVEEDPIESVMNQIIHESNSEAHVFENDDMEKDAKQGEGGIKQDGRWARGKKFLKYLKNITREFEHLKRKQYGDVQYLLRRLKKGRSDAARRAVDLLDNILSELTPTQYHNLQRLAYLMDMGEQVEMNQDRIAQGKDPVVLANPYGWSDDEILKERKRAWDLVKADQETYQAWRARQNTWYQIRSVYKEAMDEIGYDVSAKMRRAYYFRHQVLDILQAEHRRFGIKGNNKLVVPTRSSHLRKRGAQREYAMNLNYIQAEFEVMAQLIYDTQIAMTLATILTKYGSKERVEGYVRYQPREDAIFYLVHTVPGYIANRALEQNLKKVNVPTDKIKEVVALGGKYKDYWVPPEIAETLNDAISNRPSNPFLRGVKKLMTAWKMWQLLSPLRAVKYNFRNLTGDAEAVFIGSPGVFKWIPSSMKDLVIWKKTGKAPPILQEYIDRGGPEAMFQAQEMYEIIEQPEFYKQLGQSKALAKAKTPLKTWFNAMRIPTDLREMLLRYAAFKKFRNEINKNNGKPKAYVASLPEEIDILGDNVDKAYVMANDLLGAYDRISVGGQALRTYFAPFWSFQEVNMKRTVAMFRNAMNNDEIVMAFGRYVGAKGVVGTMKVGLLAMKLMTLSILFQIWNNWMWPEAEDALPDDMRERSHVILWHTKGDNPTVFYFPRIGVVGDLLEWGGVETAPGDIYEMLHKGKSFKDVIASYDKGAENLERIINKIVQSIGPQYKFPVELLSSEKFYPSFKNRQPIVDKGRYLFEQFGFQSIYDKMVGRPTPKNHWSRVAASAFIYKEDYKRLGWLATRARVEEYKRKAGLKGTGFIVTDTGNALYNMGVAWRYGDKDAVEKYFVEYLDASMNKLSMDINPLETFQNQWLKLEPLSDLNDAHLGLFFSTLDERGKEALALAYMYYAEIASGYQFLEKEK
jgi:hypothetical protein